MGGIPSGALEKMLRAVVFDGKSCSDFKNSCVTYKCKARIQRHIMKTVGLERWSKVKELYPHIAKLAFVQKWIPMVKTLKLKDSMPRNLTTLVSEAVTEAKNKKESAAASSKLLAKV